MKWTTLLAPALWATSALGIYTSNAGGGIEFSISVPDATASSGTGDIFFQIKGPSQNLQWLALGMGQQMAGSQIFVMYADGTGNVTVSPRLGKGTFMPQFYSKPNIELLEGSGIVKGQMIANVKCSNCESWQGGSLDFSNSKQPFIWAHRTGGALDSTSESEVIQMHSTPEGTIFSMDLKAAKGGSASTNPFVSSGSNGGSSTPSATPAPVPQAPISNPLADVETMKKAHGIIMGLTFIILLPLGGLIMRTLGFGGVVWFHAAWQILTLLLFTAAFGIGVHLATELSLLYKSSGTTHTTFGTVIFAIIWLQPVLGYVHHMMFKKHHSRTAVSHVHIWYGRIVMILGIINGGLGLKLAANTTNGEIAYGVVAGVMFVVYVAVATFGELRRSKGNVGREK